MTCPNPHIFRNRTHTAQPAHPIEGCAGMCGSDGRTTRTKCAGMCGLCGLSTKSERWAAVQANHVRICLGRSHIMDAAVADGTADALDEDGQVPDCADIDDC
jgi:hypothetical protein